MQHRKLSVKDRELMEHACFALKNAYAPYSRFAVGAAVRTATNTIYLGANLENASYGLGICAEVAAICAANTAGEFTIIEIAVVGRSQSRKNLNTETVVMPCGRCRQILLEASQISGVDIKVIASNASLTTTIKTSIRKLLPHGFGPQNLTRSNK